VVNRKWAVKLVTNAQMLALMASRYPKESWNDVDILGVTVRATRTIYLNTTMNTTTEELEHTFLHELGHAMLYANGVLGEHNEELVERLSGFLHQYEITKRGELNRGLESGA